MDAPRLVVSWEVYRAGVKAEPRAAAVPVDLKRDGKGEGQVPEVQRNSRSQYTRCTVHEINKKRSDRDRRYCRRHPGQPLEPPLSVRVGLERRGSIERQRTSSVSDSKVGAQSRRSSGLVRWKWTDRIRTSRVTFAQLGRRHQAGANGRVIRTSPASPAYPTAL